MSTSFDALILTKEAYTCQQPAFAHSQPEVAIPFYQNSEKRQELSLLSQIVKEATLQFCKVASIIEIASFSKDCIHLWMANFFRLSATNLSLTQA
ncbi:MAG: hypothetical protein IJN79_00560, partial [Clostridia bacterium]|nr:hypothetical protein [Clostridia bacterium]